MNSGELSKMDSNGRISLAVTLQQHLLNHQTSIGSPVFVDTNLNNGNVTNLIGSFDISHNAASLTSLMHKKWHEFRHERTSSLSSDSGIGLQISPSISIKSPHHHSTFLVSGSYGTPTTFSPPGLSPLQLSSAPDSAFSNTTTPSSASHQNKFTFDFATANFLASPLPKVSENKNDVRTTGNNVGVSTIIASSSFRNVNHSSNASTTQSPHLPHHNHIFSSHNQCSNAGQINDKNGLGALSIAQLQHIINNKAKDGCGSAFSQIPMKASTALNEHAAIIAAAKIASNSLLNIHSNGTSPFQNLYEADRNLQAEYLLNNLKFWQKQAAWKNAIDNYQLNASILSSLGANVNETVVVTNEVVAGPSIEVSKKRKLSSPNLEGRHKQYMCTYCDKDFRRPDILSRTHTDEKPYQCTECTYAARRRDVLTRHMATRHHSKPPKSEVTSKSMKVPKKPRQRCVSIGDVIEISEGAVSKRNRVLTLPGNLCDAVVNAMDTNNNDDITVKA